MTYMCFNLETLLFLNLYLQRFVGIPGVLFNTKKQFYN